jgi:amidase
MNLTEYSSYDGLGLAELVRRGEVTSHELLDAALSAIEARNPALNAIVSLHESLAREAIDRGLPDGPFRGVPIAIKDLATPVAGMPMSNGSRLFAGQISGYDAALVHRYRLAGFVVTAKTNTPEFGLSPSTEPALYGPTHNPWRHGVSAGGSSGGSGAAVAAGLFPLAHATDGGGSIRIPAAYNGLFGLKPTRGRITAGPDRGENWNGMSVGHVLTRSVRDSAAALDATAGNVQGDPYFAPPPSASYLQDAATDPGKLRIGFTAVSPGGASVEPGVVEAAERTARRCEELGHIVTPIEWPLEPAQVSPVSGVISSTHIAALIDARLRELGRELEAGEIEPVTAVIADVGRGISGVQYVQAVDAMHAAGRAIATLFGSIDVLLTPTVGAMPTELGLLAGSDMTRFVSHVGPVTAFTGLVNMTGQPAMSLPLDMAADGLPIGTQAIGRFGDESTLLQLAGQLERAYGFRPR